MNDDLEKNKKVAGIVDNKRLIGEKIKESVALLIEDVYLGELREFSSEDNGKISVDVYSYLFLVRGRDGLFNPFSLTDTDNYAVYRPSRVEDDKYVYVQGVETDGPCIVISPFTDMVRHQLDGEVVSLVDLQKYVLRTKGFFKDREGLAKENFIWPCTVRRLTEDDKEKKEKYNKFVGETAKQLGK